jgi:DNA-binding IclR family transcriptional regulator
MDQAVRRAVAILEAVARAPAPVRLKHIVEEVGLRKSTAHRLLRSWIELGYVTQEVASARYAPTLRLWELGSAIVDQHPVKRAASGFLQALHRETGETVSLLISDGDDVLYLDKLISPRSLRYSTRPGSRVAAPLTAGGKAILASDPDAAHRLARVAQRPGVSLDVDAMLDELAEIRRRGYSTSRAREGALSIGCALPGRGGRADAAISVSAPTDRLDATSEPRLIEALLSTCTRLAEQIGPV